MFYERCGGGCPQKRGEVSTNQKSETWRGSGLLVSDPVEQGETQAEAVKREAKEELGIAVRPLHKVWECLTDDKEYVLHWWHALLEDDTVAINPDEVKEYRWLTYEEMLNLKKMFDADRRFFKTIAPNLSDS